MFSLLTVVSGDSGDVTVNRLNYGLMFKKEGQIRFSRDKWLHTLELELPRSATWPKFPVCGEKSRSCETSKQILWDIQNLHTQTETMINETMATINKLIPSSHKRNIGKSKRSQSFHS